MIVKKSTILSGITILSACFFSQCSNKRKAITDIKPNIIVILADDLGYGDIKAMNSKSKIPTPNIDKMVSEGVLFTNAHAPAAVCTPSRYSILTGRYSWRSERKKGVTWVWEGPMIENDRFTIGDMLKNQGYNTACVGKWHLGVEWPTTDGFPATLKNHGKNIDYDKPIKNGPTSLGFDYYFGQEVPSFPPHAFIENDRLVVKPTEWMEPGNTGLPGAMASGWRYEDLMYSITDKAIQYIKDQAYRDVSKPFFLYFAMSAPHTPIAPHENFFGKTEVGRFGDYVYEMDYHVGRVLNLLDSLEISKNTLVVFLSDNGGVNEDGLRYTSEIGDLIKNYGHNSNGILRGIKSDAWEGGHRIPFIVKWPGHVKANSTSEALVSGVDLMATFAALTGEKLSEKVAEDSYNILPVIEGKTKVAREALVTQSGEGILSIQKGDWKLVLCSGGGGKWSGIGHLPVKETVNGKQIWKNVQLFNLTNDIGEKTDLASSNQELVVDLIKLLKQYILAGRSNPGAPIRSGNEALWEEVEWVKQMR